MGENHPTTLKQFAEQHRFRIRRDSSGDPFVPGRRLKRWDERYPAPNPKWQEDKYIGWLCEYSSNLFALVFMPRKPYLWHNVRKKLREAGFTITQNGDWEVCALFDPNDSSKPKLALKVLGVRPRRQPSAGVIERLRKTAFKSTSD